MTFLLGAVVLAVVLAWVVTWWHRRPKSMERAVDEFARGLDALAPPPERPRDRPFRGGEHGGEPGGEAGSPGGPRR